MEPETGDTSADYAIVQQVLAGDTDVFSRLIDRYEARVFALAGRHVPRDSVAELAQEIFVDAYRSLGTYSPLKGFGHWLTRIAIRRCHDYWRAHYRKREVPMSQLENDAGERIREAALADPGKAVSDVELRDYLDKVLDHLEPDDRMVLVLVHFEEYSVKEAADLLEWSTAKVKVRAHRARKRLRAILEGQTANKGVCHG